MPMRSAKHAELLAVRLQLAKRSVAKDHVAPETRWELTHARPRLDDSRVSQRSEHPLSLLLLLALTHDRDHRGLGRGCRRRSLGACRLANASNVVRHQRDGTDLHADGRALASACLTRVRGDLEGAHPDRRSAAEQGRSDKSAQMKT